jgi:MarR family transcriptional regulator for hemolysin
MNKSTAGPLPMGKMFTDAAKAYFGVLAERLEHTGIDRFFYTLLIIYEGGGNLTQQKLSDVINADKVTTVRVIDYLSKKGLVKREVNKKDRREHLLILTPKALKIIPDICATLKGIEKEMFAGISAGKKAEFSNCLTIIMGNLSKLPSERMNVKVKFDKIRKTK